MAHTVLACIVVALYSCGPIHWNNRQAIRTETTDHNFISKITNFTVYTKDATLADRKALCMGMFGNPDCSMTNAPTAPTALGGGVMDVPMDEWPAVWAPFKAVGGCAAISKAVKDKGVLCSMDLGTSAEVQAIAPGSAVFSSMSWGMPTANAGGLCRSEGAKRCVSPRPFPAATLRFDLACAVRRRRTTDKWSKWFRAPGC